MIRISLNHGSYANLLQLRQVSCGLNNIQNILSTGNKVNSAIDNPSSYYTARALNNRAADLSALLDNMGQALSVIKAATTGLETGAAVLEQASAIAVQALETAKIPAKEWFEAQVGENGAVVTTAQELKDAIDANKETICVYGQIDYFENETLTLRANQKLVGTEYFTGYSGNKKFSTINFKGTQTNAIVAANNSLISDLELNFESIENENSKLINSSSGRMSLNNLDINHKGLSTGSIHGTVYAVSNVTVDLHGVINLNTSGIGSGFAIYINSKINICEDAVVNMDIKNSLWGKAIIYNESELNVYGQWNVESDYGLLLGANPYSGNSLNIYDGAVVIDGNFSCNAGSRKNEEIYNSVNIESGAQINELISQGYQFENNTNSYKTVNAQILKDSGQFVETEAIDWNDFSPIKEKADDTTETQKIAKQYQKTLAQMDSLINDSSYKGVNLLKGENLSVNFNEARSSGLDIFGKDMRCSSLGLSTLDWQTQGDIAQSLKEIASALNQIRDFQSSLGNNYSILDTRSVFTEAITNILEEGADKLTLADMNEASADMLSLQTRQQLAINALSLATQAEQGVLRLF